LNIDGQLEAINPNTLLIFLDETGVEKLNDPNAPFFGFGGLIIEGADYFKNVEIPWHSLKLKYFDGIESPLHAADLKPISNQQIDALNEFFGKYPFGRIAITCTDKTLFEQNHKPEEILAAAIWQRIIPVVNKMKWFDILILFEENKRLMPALQQEMMSKKPKNGEKEIPIRYGTILKDPTFAGMEVADFIIHTAGRQARLMRTNSKEIVPKYQPDFEVVFKNALNQSFLNITRVSNKK
jgi:hypothetical protein